MALAEIIEVKYAINLLSTFFAYTKSDYMFVTYFRSQMNDYIIFEEIPYLHFMFFSSSQIKVIPEYA